MTQNELLLVFCMISAPPFMWLAIKGGIDVRRENQRKEAELEAIHKAMRADLDRIANASLDEADKMQREIQITLDGR